MKRKTRTPYTVNPMLIKLIESQAADLIDWIEKKIEYTIFSYNRWREHAERKKEKGMIYCMTSTRMKHRLELLHELKDYIIDNSPEPKTIDDVIRDREITKIKR